MRECKKLLISLRLLSAPYQSFRTEARYPKNGRCNEISRVDHRMSTCDKSLELIPHADMTDRVPAKCFRHCISITECCPGGASICVAPLKMRVWNKLKPVRRRDQLRRQTNPLVSYNGDRMKDQVFAIRQPSRYVPAFAARVIGCLVTAIPVTVIMHEACRQEILRRRPRNNHTRQHAHRCIGGRFSFRWRESHRFHVSADEVRKFGVPGSGCHSSCLLCHKGAGFDRACAAIIRV